MKTKILTKKEICADALAKFTYDVRQNSPLKRNDRTLDRLEAYFEDIKGRDNIVLIIVYEEAVNDPVGSMIVDLNIIPGMGIYLPWQPVIHPNRNVNTIALALIEQSKKLVMIHSLSGMEAWLPLSYSGMEQMCSTYVKWYESCGFTSVGTEYYMNVRTSDVMLDDIQLPSDIEVLSLDKVTNEEIKETVFETFNNSQDGWFLNHKKPQQVGLFLNWFNRDEAYDKDASIVLRKDDEFIGFIVVRLEDDRPNIGPIGILPKARGKGLGKALLATTLRRLKEKKYESVDLEANTINDQALGLYRGLGFKKQYRTLMYAWIP
ncbi:MAG: GNAT family N-acetyltransferase [Candidatus Thorarchaeota archaeon]